MKRSVSRSVSTGQPRPRSIDRSEAPQKTPLTLILMITTIVVYYLFSKSIKSMILGNKCVFKHKDLQMFYLKLNKHMHNFHPLEVVGSGSETQLQVGENLN